MIAVALANLFIVDLFSMFDCSSASGLMSQGVGMTNLPLGGNKLEVVIFFLFFFIFFLQYRKSMRNYKIPLAPRSLYGQFASNNTLTVGCMKEYS